MNNVSRDEQLDEANDIHVQCSRVNHGQLFRVFFLHLFFLRFKEVDFPYIYVYEINLKEN